MVPTYDDKRKVVITGGTNPVTGKTHFRLSTNASREAALAFLKQMRRYYPDAEIVIMLDRAPSHKSAIVREDASHTSPQVCAKAEYARRYMEMVSQTDFSQFPV